ncbi:hypothetical protein BDF20DRAFT_838886 [Mycotypha africana]|uniref:uncharacterized protein n=1 Tax=Mycotypha africana TaxID=64632 RepID=UPI0023013AB7|nr:uncharacterized protein BDF20DRAFT_838886 [Mycotypha africana]KAI8968898.1 hypothetical protein BDF20DRAFT_838886 [Mycotypha africana]
MSDSEYEEETTYVVFDIGGTVTKEFVEKVSHKDGGCRIIGLEEGQPYLQLGDAVFEGEIDETVGTHLFFEIEERKADTSGLVPLLSSMRSTAEEGPKQQRYTVKYACQTENIVQLTPVTIKPKDDDSLDELLAAKQSASNATIFFDSLAAPSTTESNSPDIEAMEED